MAQKPVSDNPTYQDLGRPKKARGLNGDMLPGKVLSMFLDEDRRLLLWRSLVPMILLLGSVLLANAPLASAQTFVTLRLLDAESGKPLKGISVGVMVPDKDQSLGPNKQSVSLVLVKIDSEGRGKFRVPQPPPQYVELASNGALHGCSERKLSIEEALRTGLVAAYHYDPKRPAWCSELNAQASPKPGEIVIFDKTMSNGDRLLQRHP